MALRLLAYLLILGLGAGTAQAQVDELSDLERSRYSRASYYSYSEPGDVTIQVSAWGSVRNPGLYEIPKDTHLSELFSLAGGPAIGEQSWREQRTLQVQLSRPMENGREIIYKKTMNEEISFLNENPVLREGDVLAVETSVERRFNWRDAFTVASGVGATILAIDRIISLARGN